MPPRRFCDCWFAAGLLTRLIGVIHEVDSALRALIDREAGIRDVEVVFDAPTREWATAAPRRPSMSISTTSAKTCAGGSAAY